MSLLKSCYSFNFIYFFVNTADPIKDINKPIIEINKNTGACSYKISLKYSKLSIFLKSVTSCAFKSTALNLKGVANKKTENNNKKFFNNSKVF